DEREIVRRANFRHWPGLTPANDILRFTRRRQRSSENRHVVRHYPQNGLRRFRNARISTYLNRALIRATTCVLGSVKTFPSTAVPKGGLSNASVSTTSFVMSCPVNFLIVAVWSGVRVISVVDFPAPF